MAQAAVYTDEDELVTIMKEAQNILSEQDPPAIYYGQELLVHGAAQGYRGFRMEPPSTSVHTIRSAA